MIIVSVELNDAYRLLEKLLDSSRSTPAQSFSMSLSIGYQLDLTEHMSAGDDIASSLGEFSEAMVHD